jgi:hypothetical protein
MFYKRSFMRKRNYSVENLIPLPAPKEIYSLSGFSLLPVICVCLFAARELSAGGLSTGKFREEDIRPGGNCRSGGVIKYIIPLGRYA